MKRALLLLILCASAIAQDKAKPAAGIAEDKPPAVTAEQSIEVLQATRDAYKALVLLTEAKGREQEALKNAAQAKLDQQPAQKALDEANARITAEMKTIRELCRADEKIWNLTDSFEWVKKKEEKK